MVRSMLLANGDSDGLMLALLLCAGAALCAAIGPECPSEAAPDTCRDEQLGSDGEYFFKIEGRTLRISFSKGAYYELYCDPVSRSLEHPSLPRFPRFESVPNVTLHGCAPPAAGTFSEALALLNVSASEALRLIAFPKAPPLRSDHFIGLEGLNRLELRGDLHSEPPRLPPMALRPLRALQHLVVIDVLSSDAFDLLPAELSTLRLWFTELRVFAPKVATGLVALSMRERVPVRLDAARTPNLGSLTLTSTNSSMIDGTNAGQLYYLHMENWNEAHPRPWTECEKLEQLTLTFSVASELPAGWVARCPILRELSVRLVDLAPLPRGLLQNATALRKLTLSKCGLKTLPVNLFADTTHLDHIDLSSNRLETLPSEVFSSMRRLVSLNLSHNMLTSIAINALQPLFSLHFLDLSHNRHLTDLCRGTTDVIKTIAAPSVLRRMTDLNTLLLKNTSVRTICRDWREGMPHLTLLDLRDTNVTVLKYEDTVQHRNQSGARMIVGAISANTTLRLDYTRYEYEIALNERSSVGDVTIEFAARFLCDCSAYWAALAFRNAERFSKIPKPRCTVDDRSLDEVPLDELVCDEPDLCVGAMKGNCRCMLRDDEHQQAGIATALCEQSGLRAVPGPLPSGPAWRLLLAHNNITRVDTVDLPDNLLEIDLSDNALVSFDRDVAVALFSRRVRIAHNPLGCDCDALPLLRELETKRTLDSENVTCADGSMLPLSEELTKDCTSGSLLLAGALLSGLLASALLSAAVLFSEETRLRLKIMLERSGWRWHGEDRADESDGYQFDAFVSHAHEDEQWVRELVARLENECGYRVCVHYRDWAPGEWIPAQISASVRASRRTLAIVSGNFLNSSWARLEFREAHAHAKRDLKPRLVVVLLEEPAQLPLDSEMRSFIENNTYVRWGDQWFWKKLEHAMPKRPRTSSKQITKVTQNFSLDSKDLCSDVRVQ